VKYVSDAGALFKRRWCILNGIVLPWRRSVLTAPNRVHSGKFSVLFLSFLQQLQAKNVFMIGTRKTEVLNSLITNITAKANDTTDILQTFR